MPGALALKKPETVSQPLLLQKCFSFVFQTHRESESENETRRKGGTWTLGGQRLFQLISFIDDFSRRRIVNPGAKADKRHSGDANG
jgi:hypothetical protein